MIVRPASAWAEAVFHVLAHVDTDVAASCFEPAWIAYASARLGPASGRALAEDVRVLARALADHDKLARAQAIAWLFAGPDEARAAAQRDLSGLDPPSGALALVRGAGAGAEVLRAAAELELDGIAALGAAAIDGEALDRALATVARAAPELASHAITLVRPLPRRGRAMGGTIFVGAPGVAGARTWHVAWQAAHEAIVLAVGARRPGVAFADLEREALGLLRVRARRAGLAGLHARWLATLDVRALGPIPDVEDRAE